MHLIWHFSLRLISWAFFGTIG
uniref:Uncharacterized protein n=1 Tax=Tetranychus urticae TaxID=32264 RepID=T1JSS6_TETUR